MSGCQKEGQAGPAMPAPGRYFVVIGGASGYFMLLKATLQVEMKIDGASVTLVLSNASKPKRRRSIPVPAGSRQTMEK